tara:strand:+ start:118 stop:555 length:438 start_codon:yes stop_codon:yes gene_type:complete
MAKVANLGLVSAVVAERVALSSELHLTHAALGITEVASLLGERGQGKNQKEKEQSFHRGPCYFHPLGISRVGKGFNGLLIVYHYTLFKLIAKEDSGTAGFRLNHKEQSYPTPACYDIRSMSDHDRTNGMIRAKAVLASFEVDTAG